MGAIRTLSLFLVLLSAPRAFAYADYYSSSMSSSNHPISVGAGIASPGATSAYAENPAGLAYNLGTTIQGFAGSDNSNLNPLDLGGQAFFGNGSVGADLGLQTSTYSGSALLLDYGLAANIPTVDISLGLAGTYAITNGGASAWGLNAGALFNAHGPVRFGATVYGLTDNVDGFGAGVAFDLSPDATFVIDGGADRDFNGKTITPGLEVRVLPVELALSYGIDLDNNGASPIPRGTTFGLGVKLSESVHLIGYYNEINLYYLALTFHL